MIATIQVPGCKKTDFDIQFYNYYNKGKKQTKTQTHIATTIDAIAPAKARFDNSVKEVLADVQVLARILKYTVTEFQEQSIDEIILCIDETQIEIGRIPIKPGLTNLASTNLGKVKASATEDTTPNEGTIYFDIRFPVHYGSDHIKILINVEAQKSTNASNLGYHLENRIIYYLSRMISSQKDVEFFHSDYDAIKKVYSIWICMDSKDSDDSINELVFAQRNIFGRERHFSHLDKMHGVVISIRANTHAQESKNKLISMLEDLLSDTEPKQKKKQLTTKHNMKMTVSLEGRISNMCNLSDVFEERAEKRGLEKGMKQGMAQGIIALVETLKELNKSNDYIIHKIAEKFSIPEEEALKFL